MWALSGKASRTLGTTPGWSLYHSVAILRTLVCNAPATLIGGFSAGVLAGSFALTCDRHRLVITETNAYRFSPIYLSVTALCMHAVASHRVTCTGFLWHFAANIAFKANDDHYIGARPRCRGPVRTLCSEKAQCAGQTARFDRSHKELARKNTVEFLNSIIRSEGRLDDYRLAEPIRAGWRRSLWLSFLRSLASLLCGGFLTSAQSPTLRRSLQMVHVCSYKVLCFALYIYVDI